MAVIDLNKKADNLCVDNSFSEAQLPAAQRNSIKECNFIAELLHEKRSEALSFLRAFSDTESLFSDISDSYKFTYENASALQKKLKQSRLNCGNINKVYAAGLQLIDKYLQLYRQAAEMNLCLLEIVAASFARKKYDYQESYQNGYLGLVHALDTFRPDKNCSFNTYATHCIGNFIRKKTIEDGMVFIPYVTQRKVRKIELSLDRINDGASTDYEMIQKLQLSRALQVTLSLVQTSKKTYLLADSNENSANQVPDRNNKTALEVLEEKEFQEITPEAIIGFLEEALGVNTREYKAVILKFGLSLEHSHKERTYEEVALEMQLKSKQNAEYYVKKALKQLKSKLVA